MRFECVEASAFGPFAGQTLRFGTAMTVVCGRNESGKSSWHAALYVGLCGMRRAKGSLRKEDREFTERHKPWDAENWDVAAVIRLDDGRRIELRHDLEGKMDCRAVDADLGRDVSGEIMLDGSPDGSRWLGLDRRSFLAVACVRQAEVLALLDDHALLQEHLQRAAATAGADATAAAAIARIAAFWREQVGQDRGTSTRPLRQAKDRLLAAQQELEQLRGEHAEYLRVAARADTLAEEAEAARQRFHLVQAGCAATEAERWRRRLVRAQQLAARGAGEPPVGLVADDALAQDVAGVLRQWDQRPQIPALCGATAAELRALEMGAVVADVDPALQDHVERAQRQLDALPGRHAQRVTMFAGTLLVTVGLIAIVRDSHLPGLVLMGTGLALMVWATIRGGASARVRALEALRAAETTLGVERARLAAAAAHRSALAAQRATREAAERNAGEVAARLQAAETRLREGAARCGIGAADAGALAAGLRAWQRQRAAALQEQEKTRQRWVELQTLLERGTLQDLATHTARRVEEAERLASGLPATAVAAVSLEDNDVLQLERLRQAAEHAGTQAAQMKGQVELRARQLRSVAEAEEALATAEGELERVRQLEETLNLTRDFLEHAQQRVHRDVARVLAETIRPWLPAVTANRYHDVRVDPQSLAVTVCDNGGTWRDAALLSHGTAEQVYLLLRMALAKHLTQSEETCSLILDDVTVQCDSGRKTAVLRLLHDLSRERQIILFSQEDEVLHWAEQNLQAPQDCLARLEVANGES